jgi:hypothetical protein
MFHWAARINQPERYKVKEETDPERRKRLEDLKKGIIHQGRM